jgi:hypothetical protein
VSGASVLASADITGLERAIQALTGEVTKNTAALGGMATGADAAGAGLTRMAGGARTASNELRVLEGAMPIRAAAQFLTQFQAINTAMTLAFPVFGAIALVGILDTIVSKVTDWANAHNPVIQAQKESLSLLEQAGKEYDKLAEKAHKRRLDEVEQTFGKPAREKMEADDYDRAAKQEDADQIRKLEQLLGAINRVGSYSGQRLKGVGAADAGVLSQATYLLGMKPGERTGLEGVNAGDTPTASQASAARELSVGVQQALATARMQQTDDTASASDMRSKVSQEARKKADEEAKKRQHELDEAEKQAAAYLRSAENFELTGLDRINAVYREKLELLGKTKKAIEDINAGYAIEVQRETAKEVEQGAGKMDKLHDWWMGHGTLDAATGGFLLPVDAPKTLRGGYTESQQKNDEEYVRTGLKVLQASDDSDVDAVRRSAALTIHGNSAAVAGGRMTPQSAASKDYTTRVSDAQAMFQIDTRRLDIHKLDAELAKSTADLAAGKQSSLSEQESKDIDRLADLRKKRDEEIYHAGEQYEIQLQTLREKDLQKYHETAGSFFDAMHSHTTNQWFRSFAVGQEKEVFSNAVTPLIQNAGHMLGGVTGGFNPGGLLTGTVFDPANKGANDASTTAKQTARTADEVHALRADVRAMSGAPAPTDAAGGASSSTDVFNLPMSHNPLAIFGSDIGGWTGSGSGLGTGAAGTSALFNAGGGSSLTQFMSGLGGGGSNPLQAIFGGMSTNGGTVTQLTGAQQAGAAVGTAAMLAGAGISIASGINQGGVGGYTKAASAGMGAAAMLDPEPISKTILASAAAITGLVGAVFGTGPQQRSKDIFNALSSNQYLSPTALNVIQGMNGTYEDFDARGNLRTSTMSAVPTVAEPYITSRVVDGQRTYYDVNGNVTSPYSGGAKGTGQAPIAGAPTIIIQAFDSESLHEYLQKPANSHAVGEAAASHLERHDGRLANAVRFIAG